MRGGTYAVSLGAVPVGVVRHCRGHGPCSCVRTRPSPLAEVIGVSGEHPEPVRRSLNTGRAERQRRFTVQS